MHSIIFNQTYQQGIDMKKLFSSKEAAQYLGYSNPTMVKSRVEGTLGGRPAPEHIKMGFAVKYDIEDLNQWIADCKEASQNG